MAGESILSKISLGLEDTYELYRHKSRIPKNIMLSIPVKILMVPVVRVAHISVWLFQYSETNALLVRKVFAGYFHSQTSNLAYLPAYEYVESSCSRPADFVRSGIQFWSVWFTNKLASFELFIYLYIKTFCTWTCSYWIEQETQNIAEH